MFTPKEIEERIISYLNGSADLLALQSGGKGAITRKDKRQYSTIWDVTVSTVALPDGDVQLGMHNVNVWVQDIQEPGSLGKIRSVVDIDTIDLMVKAVVDVLGGNKGIFWEQGNIYVSGQSSAFANIERKEHFVSIRVRSRLHNKLS